ncbi:MAG: hypothetical protein KAX30_04405 [Candidatus Atribacteria bacterium]|nr:hypothetical protein [Candidatus Atribacteria bacterium]
MSNVIVRNVEEHIWPLWLEKILSRVVHIVKIGGKVKCKKCGAVYKWNTSDY